MRWKLLIIASALATLVGAGASLGLAHWLLGTAARFRTPDLTALAVLAFPVATVSAASIFVYRHTARRRTLQAALTATLTALLTLGAVVAGTLVLAANAPKRREDAPPSFNVD
jgi:hypothetical protein